LHARGVFAISTLGKYGEDYLLEAADLYDTLGFAWRAAESRLALRHGKRSSARTAYAKGRTFLVERFPRSHLLRELADYVPPIVIDGPFSLTPAQIAIVRALCSGRTTRDIALERGTSLGTIYNQLKDIYRRTDLHSIRDLIRYFRATSA
jgi:DNA-binding CsgD family transcriptional regulator